MSVIDEITRRAAEIEEEIRRQAETEDGVPYFHPMPFWVRVLAWRIAELEQRIASLAVRR